MSSLSLHPDVLAAAQRRFTPLHLMRQLLSHPVVPRPMQHCVSSFLSKDIVPVELLLARVNVLDIQLELPDTSGSPWSVTHFATPQEMAAVRDSITRFQRPIVSLTVAVTRRHAFFHANDLFDFDATGANASLQLPQLKSLSLGHVVVAADEVPKLAQACPALKSLSIARMQALVHAQGNRMLEALLKQRWPAGLTTLGLPMSTLDEKIGALKKSCSAPQVPPGHEAVLGRPASKTVTKLALCLDCNLTLPLAQLLAALPRLTCVDTTVRLPGFGGQDVPTTHFIRAVCPRSVEECRQVSVTSVGFGRATCLDKLSKAKAMISRWRKQCRNAALSGKPEPSKPDLSTVLSDSVFAGIPHYRTGAPAATS